MLRVDSLKDSINSFFDVYSKYLTPQNKKIIAIVSAAFCTLAVSYALIKYFKSGRPSFSAKKEKDSEISVNPLPKKESKPDPLPKEENDSSIKTDPPPKEENESSVKTDPLPKKESVPKEENDSSGKTDLPPKEENEHETDTDPLPKKESEPETDTDLPPKEENEHETDTDPLPKSEANTDSLVKKEGYSYKSVSTDPNALTDPEVIHKNIHSIHTNISLEHIKTFLEKGGEFRFIENNTSIENNTRVFVSKNDNNNKPVNYIVGCRSGQNLSQALGAFLKEKGCTISALLDGSSGVNPWMDFPGTSFFDDDNFEKIFKSKRMRSLCGKNDDDRSFYDDYFKSLGPTHFLCFGNTTASPVIKRLAESDRQNLTGFKVTYFSWEDTMLTPPTDPATGKAMERRSEACYQAFKTKLEETIKIIEKE